MKRSTTWAIVGIIWGGAIGFVFGILPAYTIAWSVMEELNIEPAVKLFTLLYGASCLLLTLLGGVSGYLLGRETPRES
ncbi:MAG: hypothetical protein WBC44_06795 [Planctomycetaceae bacterium]